MLGAGPGSCSRYTGQEGPLVSYQSISLGTLKARLQDRVEAVPFWTPAEATRAINEGLRLWNAMTGFWRAPFLTRTVPNDPYVALPGTLVQAARVSWNGIPLEPASLADFDYTLGSWRTATTATPGLSASPQYWAPLSLQLLVIYPADATALNQILVDGVRDTPILVNDADFVDLGQEEFNTLLGYAQHVLAFKVGGATLTASYQGWQAFLKAGAARNKQFAASAYYRSLMGLDQQRRERPTSVPLDTLADEAAQQDAAAASAYQQSKFLGGN